MAESNSTLIFGAILLGDISTERFLNFNIAKKAAF
jgi:hypothetical protein